MNLNYDAMIIIDMQTALIEAHPYGEEGVIKKIQELLMACRAENIPVIYVRHDGGEGDELEANSRGWQIYEKIAPQKGEKIVEKQYNSAFRKTGLNEYLKELRAKKLILCGMQTEYCFDVSCKVAFEYGYEVTIPQGGTTTFDNEFAAGEALAKYYEEKIWNNRYAKVIPTEEIIKNMKSFS